MLKRADKRNVTSPNGKKKSTITRVNNTGMLTNCKIMGSDQVLFQQNITDKIHVQLCLFSSAIMEVSDSVMFKSWRHKDNKLIVILKLIKINWNKNKEEKRKFFLLRLGFRSLKYL